MRREGYALQVSRPEVILRRHGSLVTEPDEARTITVPAEFQGVMIEDVGARRGERRHMKLVHGGTGSSKIDLECAIPTRGIIA